MTGPGPAHSRSRQVLAPQSAHLLLAAPGPSPPPLVYRAAAQVTTIALRRALCTALARGLTPARERRFLTPACWKGEPSNGSFFCFPASPGGVHALCRVGGGIRAPQG